MPLDAIVAPGLLELRLATRLRERLGREVPIVFRAPSSTRADELASAVRLPGVTGVIDASPI
ncbi:MAG: hypothetical protein ACO273_11670, partial [Burkholderiales bacterium]